MNALNTHAPSREPSTDAYIILRSFVPNSEFDLPRWPVDGYFFEPFSGTQFKVAVVFKGVGTLFCTPIPRVREIFLRQHEIFSRRSTRGQTLEERKYLQEILKNAQKVEAPQSTGIVFEAGDTARATIHSEPPMKETRIFLSIVPGSTKDVQNRQAFDVFYTASASRVTHTQKAL